jgi:murein DD-endopeptidase MepM/ murein hydrolase activator NlpD
MTRLLLLLALLAALLPVAPARAEGDSLGVQDFLDQQPGRLKSYSEDGRSAAAIIAGSSLYYGLSPRLHLALLEASADLLSDPSSPDIALRRPFGVVGPDGFAAQIEWASRELRAGLGPYSRPPTVRFTDGITFTLTLNQAMEGVAVQRFLAQGRSSSQWRAAVDAFGQAFQHYFNNELVQIGIGGPQPALPVPAAGDGFLGLPWPAGTRVFHLAYFDHVYPTVDTGHDGNSFVVTYQNQGNVQYNGHDGHDYYFPDQPVGTPILATAAGVAYARTHKGNGVLIVHPGGYETVYWHLSGFAPVFKNRIDSDAGVSVQAGDLIGYSGSSGFVTGTPHLHFEVRRYGKQVDPYGWYGPGPDPCAAYAGCLASSWLWSSALRGSYDFTPPDLPVGAPVLADDTSPVGTLAVNPPEDLLFQVSFDGHPVQTVGAGFPEIAGELAYRTGRSGQALSVSWAGLAYPSADNLLPEVGTISLWAELPAPEDDIRPQYLIAASANPNGGPEYTGTLTLRLDPPNETAGRRWTFWTVAATGASANELSVADTLGPGWHHFAISWDIAAGRKLLFIDGVEVARAEAVALADDVGSVLQIGRFSYDDDPAKLNLDDLAIYGRVLDADEVAGLAAASNVDDRPVVVHKRRVFLDTNAIDREGGIVAVQLGINGEFADPQPYYDGYRWLLPTDEGQHILAARYKDRAGNTTTVSRTVILDLPPRLDLDLEPTGPLGATVTISANDNGPLMMQVSQRNDFDDAEWQPIQGQFYWAWNPMLSRRLYVRLRDMGGNLSASKTVAQPGGQVYLPLIIR